MRKYQLATQRIKRVPRKAQFFTQEDQKILEDLKKEQESKKQEEMITTIIDRLKPPVGVQYKESDDPFKNQIKNLQVIQERIEDYQRGFGQQYKDLVNRIDHIQNILFDGKDPTIPQVLEKYYKDHEAMKTELTNLRADLNPLRNIPTTELIEHDLNYTDKSNSRNMFFQALQQFNVKKFGSYQDYEKALQATKLLADNLSKQYNIKAPTNTELRMLLAIDTPSVMSWLPTVLAKYGYPIIQDAYKQYVQPKLVEWLGDGYNKLMNYLGGDEGFNVVDFSQPFALEPYIKSGSTNINYTTRTPFNNSTIDLSFLKSWICPELYIARQPSDAKKTGVIRAVTTFTVSTNATGNVLVTIVRNNFQSVAYIMSDWVPNTGAFGTPTTIVGELAVFDHYAKYATTAGSVTFDSLLSQNDNAFIQLAYADTPIITTQIKANTISDMQLYQSGNAYSNYRLNAPLEPKNLILNDQTYGIDTPKFIVAITGGPPNTTVGKITFTQNFEFVPKSESAVLYPLESPKPGYLTADILRDLVIRYPILSYLSLSDAVRVSDMINNDNPLDDIIKTLKPTQAFNKYSGSGMKADMNSNFLME